LGTSRAAKLIILVLLLVIIAGGGVVAFKFYDFTQNNPKFCVTCHLMEPAYEAWAQSEHAGINCHDCHHLSIVEQNKLLINFVLHRPTKVPPRHGKIIVPWKYCIKCHWEKDERYPQADMINDSPMHAKHYFMEQIECSQCHGYVVHQFTPEARFCVRCHQGKEVHGAGMEALACLNCHTDRTVDLRPDRFKCLYCHGTAQVRKRLIEEGTLDVTHYQPEPELIRRATKISYRQDSPMQFYCYECHKPHEAQIRPGKGHCLKCHPKAPQVGQHSLHVQMMGLSCKDCHKPHLWRVSEAGAKKLCVGCHEYRSPEKFLM
jgi:hypothetical protein